MGLGVARSGVGWLEWQLILLFWTYLSHLKSDFDVVRSIACLWFTQSEQSYCLSNSSSGGRILANNIFNEDYYSYLGILY